MILHARRRLYAGAHIYGIRPHNPHRLRNVLIGKIADLIGGHADVSFQNLGSVTSHIKAGKLKVLGVTAAVRGGWLEFDNDTDFALYDRWRVEGRLGEFFTAW